jgi:hypothetical protein
MSLKQELKEAEEAIASAREMLQFQKDLYESSVRESGFDPDIIRKEILGSTVLTVEDQLNDDEQWKELFRVVSIEEVGEIPEDKCDEYRENLREACKEMADLMESESEIEELEKESKENMAEYINYISSEEYEQKQLDKLNALVEEERRLTTSYAEEKVENKKANIYRRLQIVMREISMISGRYTFDFIKREPGIDKTVEAFFSNKTSSYTMEKFYSKCKQLKMDPSWYRYFFNLEEKFLEEKYYPFNNLFLFRCVRYIGYADATKDVRKIKTVTNTLSRLYYNKFPNANSREIFLNSVRTYLDQFIDAGYTEKFEAENILQPNHPERIKKDKEREEKLREQYYAQILKMGFAETIDETITNMTTDELVAFLDEKNREMLEEAERKAAEKKAEEAARLAEEDDEDDNEGNDGDVTENTSEEAPEDSATEPVPVSGDDENITSTSEPVRNLADEASSSDTDVTEAEPTEEGVVPDQNPPEESIGDNIGFSDEVTKVEE